MPSAIGIHVGQIFARLSSPGPSARPMSAEHATSVIQESLRFCRSMPLHGQAHCVPERNPHHHTDRQRVASSRGVVISVPAAPAIARATSPRACTFSLDSTLSV